MSKAFLLLILIAASSFSFAREAEFSWQASPEAIEYELQVSPSRNFSKIIYQTKTVEPLVKVNLNFGNFYFRIRAIDNKKRPGLWSRPETLSITPYSPEPLTPETGASYNYFEKKSLVGFSWDKLEGDGVTYEILITNSTGKKILEKSSKNASLVVDSLGEGNYYWQVRGVINKKLYSQYSAKVPFQITQTSLKAPSLVHPKDKTDISAFREDKFEWAKDPIAKYTDLELERTDKPEKLDSPLANKQGNTLDMPSLMPGLYKWRVIAKEEKDTVGAASNWAEFKITTAVASKDSHVFRFSTGITNNNFSFQSDRFGSVDESGTEKLNSTEIYNRFQVNKTFGIGIEMQQSFFKSYLDKQEVATKNSLYMEFRFGENDFIQNNFFGYRMQDVYDRNASLYGERLSLTGPFLGFVMEGYLGFQSKLRLYASYFKPKQALQGNVDIKSDFYEARISYAYNVLERFWLEYEISMERSFTEVGYNNGSSNSKITSEKMTPLQLKLSYEY